MQLAVPLEEAHRLRTPGCDALEALLKTGQLSIGVPHAVEDLIAQLKSKGSPDKGPAAAGGDAKNGEAAAAAANNNQAVLDRLDHLEQELMEMNNRLRRIESSLPGSKSD